MARGDSILRCSALGACAVLVVAAWFSVGHSAQPQTRPAGKTDLGGAERYLAHLSTDKPIYRAGEKVYVRGVILRADTHTPLPKGQTSAFVEIKGPKGDTVASGYASAQDSVVGFAWEVPAGQAGGQYTIRMSFPSDGYAPAERKFDIRAYRAPRLRSQIVFLRDGYGPGDSVTATLHVERAEGGAPAGATVRVTARVDGAEAYAGQARVDAAGNCTVSFKLPAQIERGEGTLAMSITDGGVVETATKTIPILLQTVDLSIYPEGGDLVAGLENRVYIEARTPAQKPADIAGVIVDAQGQEAGTFRTEHEGRGRFSFVPRRGVDYSLRVTEPAGIARTFALPRAKDDGVTITSAADIVGQGEPVRLTLRSTRAGSYRVTLSKREVEVAAQTVQLEPMGQAPVVLTPPASADGVLIATVWDEQGRPLAERLIFRRPARQINVTVVPDQSTYVPADRVSLRITTTDDQGRPVGAVVGMTVTDDSVLEMIEKREQAPRLPVMVLLENDVRELADAHVYLDNSNPKAPLAVDLLLGTQGWRRFAFVEPARLLAQHGDAARRVLALKMVTAAERELGERRREVLALRALADRGEVLMEMAGVPQAAAANLPGEGRAAKDNLGLDDAAAAAEPPARKAMEAALADHEARENQMALRIRRAGAGQIAMSPVAPSIAWPIVREYAHQVRPNRMEADRTDFTETLYWHAGVKTDQKTGQATVSFSLSDAVTSFRIFADAFDTAGGLGSSSSTIESIEPFYIEPKIPLEVTRGDIIELPIAMVNGLRRDLPMVRITPQAHPGLAFSEVADGFTLRAGARVRRILPIQVGSGGATADLIVNVTAGPFRDRVTRPLAVQPPGFPVEFARGGMLGPNAAVAHEIVIPASAVPDSTQTVVAIYPTPLGNLTEALERLIREPSGCFEQTSSISYPLVMAQQYFLTHQGIDPRLIERSREKLDKAYQRLTGFECKQRGYEWFGGDPGHEALTAYGLMQFVDMKEVRQVDQQMLQRTRQWLLDRRDGKGGFGRSAQALDSFGRAPEATTNAYIVWALLESGEKGLEKEIAAVRESALASQDSYVIALGANVMKLSGDDAAARTLMDRLVKKLAADGSVDGAVTSITNSGGEALKIETTALSLLAWLRDPSYMPYVERSMKWLSESCKSGRFGSTQSTILALRAIINYDKSRARPKAPGSARLYVDGRAVGEAVPFTPETQGALKLADISELMTPGKHTIELRMDGGSAMPFSLSVNYYDALPASSDQCKVGLAVALRDAQVTEGTVTEAKVTVTNRSNEAISMPVAIVGIPGGLEVRHDQLKELVKAGTIDAYEVIGREVVLYWRGMKPQATVELPLSLVAAVPGTYTGPASRAYLYYTDEFKQWVSGAKVRIVAGGGQ